MLLKIARLGVMMLLMVASPSDQMFSSILEHGILHHIASAFSNQQAESLSKCPLTLEVVVVYSLIYTV